MKKILLLPILLGLFSACVPYRSVVNNLPKIKTNQIFPLEEVKPSSAPYIFQEKMQNDFGQQFQFANLMNLFQQRNLETVLEENKTRGFMVILRDTIIYETYFKGNNKESYFTSFSLAKSTVSSLIGIALSEGKIGSINESITQYLPEIDQELYAKVSIEHLLQHTSGLKFSGISKIYYGKNVLKHSLPKGFRQAPGTGFRYENANTQLLGVILERVYGKPIYQLWEEKVWTKIGTEAPIHWALDSKKHQQAKTFCCIDATARDFARLGRVWMNEGVYQGEQIFPKEWMNSVRKPDLNGGGTINYKYQFWQAPQAYNCFLAAGMFGQMVFMCPEKELMIVRLGERTKVQMDDKFWIPVFLQLIDQMEMKGFFQK